MLLQDPNLYASLSGNDNINNNSSSLITKTETGMKSVPQWLKHLRLHKYAALFSKLSYKQMMELTDEKLMDQNITLGARKKILTNIEKLKKRSERLQEMINVIIKIMKIYLQ